MPNRPQRRPQRRPLTNRLAEALAFGAFAAGPAFAEIARQVAGSLGRRQRRVLHPA